MSMNTSMEQSHIMSMDKVPLKKKVVIAARLT